MPIENLRADFEGMAALMHRSWGGAAHGAFLYDAAFLANAYEYPEANLEDAPAWYVDDKLMGFVCAFPRKAHCAGRELTLQCLTFLTCAPELRGQHIGSQLWREALLRARNRGYDGCIYYFQDRSPTELIAAKSASSLDFGLHRLLSFGYLGKALGGLTTSASPSVATPPAVETFLELSKSLPGGSRIDRSWSPTEANWQCHQRRDALAVSQVTKDVSGILTAYLMPLDDQNHSRICLIEDVLLHRLAASDRRALVSELLAEAASRGATTAIVPLLGYADLSVFRELGFRRLLRKMHAELTLFDRSLAPTPGDAIYMDVL